MPEEAKAKSALYAGMLLFFLTLGGHTLQLEPVNNQFFAFASWTCLLLFSAILYRAKGSAPLVSRTEEFLVLALWSAFFGACLELLNLRLGLWQYTSQPLTLSARWTGRLLSWAVMLPFLFTTAELIGFFRPFRKITMAPFRPPKDSARLMHAAGAVMLALALLLPGYFSALLCCAFFLPAEALNLKLGLPSLLRELQAGLPEKTCDLLASGTLCGLLWNYWNSLAGGKWEYLVSFAGLPAAGCAAALFAVQAYSLYSLASYTRGGKNWEESAWTLPGRQPHFLAAPASYFVIIVALYLALRLTDSFTTTDYLGWV